MIEIRCACGCRYRIDESRIGDTARCPNLDCGIVMRIERRDSIPVAPPLPEYVTSQDWLRESTSGFSRKRDSSRRKRDIKIGVGILAGLAVLLGLIWLNSWISKPLENAPASSPTAETTGPPTEQEMRNSPNSEAYIKPLPPPPKVSEEPVFDFKHLKHPKSNPTITESPSNVGAVAENAPAPGPEVVTPTCADGKEPERPETGSPIETWLGIQGQSTLEIINGSHLDAAVHLFSDSPNSSSRFVYVRSHDSYTLRGIQPDTYYLVFDLGHQWVSDCGQFLRDEVIQEFEKPLAFVHTETDEADYWTVTTATLHEVPFGNVRAKRVDRRRFWHGSRRFALQP
jgi:hypothetical protein